MTDREPTERTAGEASAQRGNAMATGEVAAMFDRIAHRYDLLNAIISGFQEPRWRRAAVADAGLRPGMRAIDVATGTGMVAESLASRVAPSGHVVGVDISHEMIERARARLGDRSDLELVEGDALALPFPDGSFDAATIAFGMRNLPDYTRGFAEMRRVVVPGGRVVCLEIARPRGLIGRLGRIWFERAVPALGAAFGQREAYRYLVSSVRAYPDPERIAGMMRAAGLVDVRWRPLTFGMVTIHVGIRPPA